MNAKTTAAALLRAAAHAALDLIDTHWKPAQGEAKGLISGIVVALSALVQEAEGADHLVLVSALHRAVALQKRAERAVEMQTASHYAAVEEDAVGLLG